MVVENGHGVIETREFTVGWMENLLHEDVIARDDARHDHFCGNAIRKEELQVTRGKVHLMARLVDLPGQAQAG